MHIQKIPLETWERRSQFEHYLNRVPCTYNMCVHMDVTHVLAAAKANGLRFFPVIAFALSHAVNHHREFCMTLTPDRKPAYFDVVHPCYTVFHSQAGCFSNVWTAYDPVFSNFYEQYLKDRRQYGGPAPTGDKPCPDGNIFYISCIPWVSFDSFQLQAISDPPCLAPIFTIGKYYGEKDRVLMPLSVQVHHAACDGFHTARLINEVQEWLDRFQPDRKEGDFD